MIDYHQIVRSRPDVAKMIVYQDRVLRETVTNNPWIPFVPFPKQALFLSLPVMESLYGGSLAGGKSQALLGAAAQYVDRPNYRALIIRKTISELQMPGALIERSQKWWAGTAAKYNANLHRWTFPSGAEIWFGYLGSKDWSRYQSSEWDFIGFDELVTIPEASYRMLFGRVRQNQLAQDLWDVPPRVRGASNPPTADQEATGWWVKTHFVDRGYPYFVQAGYKDNPYIDDAYLAGLQAMYDPVTFEKLAMGDWEIRSAGRIWRRDMFTLLPRLPYGLRVQQVARGWDLAGTKPHEGNKDPDWTRGVKMLRGDANLPYDYYITDMISMQDEPGPVANMVHATAMLDGKGVVQVIPQDPAQAGKFQRDFYEQMLARFSTEFVRESKQRGAKLTKATPFAITSRNQRIAVIDGPFVNAMMTELETMPDGTHDDVMDACANAFNKIALDAPIDTDESGFEDAFRYRPIR